MLTKTKEKIWTYKEYLEIEDENRYEILKGKLVMAPAPNRFHQDICGNLYFLIKKYLQKNNIGKIYTSPIDVVLREDIVVQPDLVIVLKENYKILQEKGIIGIPDIVIEIISPSSVERDLIHKKNIYEEAGIKEYWIVFPKEKMIEILFLNKDKQYDVFHIFSIEKNKKLTSPLLKKLEINLNEIFEE
ncbi:MAG: hypothetical protein KatS3mg068_2626 [Candidatus Sericytochromatia bacterium]|nr:MAG: hypothetical protein KatS3mg068_2626 [Candidatus Sericytochromatia bacterium]